MVREEDAETARRLIVEYRQNQPDADEGQNRTLPKNRRRRCNGMPVEKNVNRSIYNRSQWEMGSGWQDKQRDVVFLYFGRMRLETVEW